MVESISKKQVDYINFFDFLNLVLRSKKTIFIYSFGLMALSVLYIFMKPPIHTSSVMLDFGDQPKFDIISSVNYVEYFYTAPEFSIEIPIKDSQYLQLTYRGNLESGKNYLDQVVKYLKDLEIKKINTINDSIQRKIQDAKSQILRIENEVSRLSKELLYEDSTKDVFVSSLILDIENYKFELERLNLDLVKPGLKIEQESEIKNGKNYHLILGVLLVGFFFSIFVLVFKENYNRMMAKLD